MAREMSRIFVFKNIYNTIAAIEERACDPGSFIEIEWNNPQVLSCLVSYQKTSILHYYIFSTIVVWERWDFHHNSDLYEESEDMRASVEECLAAHDIDFITYEDCHSNIASAKWKRDPFYTWFLINESAFEQLWNVQTDEAFHLLFSNRSFLLEFNQSLATYLAECSVILPKNYLNSKGRLKRQTFIPAWLKRAVFYRDQGRCVLCQKDLTGLVNTGVDLHIDHIVPLNKWGVNDPCNLQLLCAECNERKSDKEATTSMRYVPWWNY